MLSCLRSQLTYANVMATIAVFVALGGSSYAVIRVGSSEIEDGSVRSRDLKDGTIAERDVRRSSLGRRSIREGSLRRVPRARVADGLSPQAEGALKLRCPNGTVLAAALCFEVDLRPTALPYITAVGSCSAVNLGNRRLPTHTELQAFVSQGGTPAPGGEMTSTAFESRTNPGSIDVLLLSGLSSITIASGAADHPFRCVTNPING